MVVPGGTWSLCLCSIPFLLLRAQLAGSCLPYSQDPGAEVGVGNCGEFCPLPHCVSDLLLGVWSQVVVGER